MVLLYSCAIWLSNFISYIKGGMMVDTLKQDTEVNISVQEGWKWGGERALQ